MLVGVFLARKDALKTVGLRGFRAVLGGSWVVISGVISPLIWVITIVILLITLLITTHEPPSRGLGLRGLVKQP